MITTSTSSVAGAFVAAVPSTSHPGTSYAICVRVDGKGLCCSCPSYVYTGEPCRHLRALVAATAQAAAP